MSQDSIDMMLQSSKPNLTEAERSRLWSNIARQLDTPSATPSPYMEFLRTYIMNPFVILFMCIVGTTSVAAAVDKAKPGDSLFAFEQMGEQVLLAFTTSENDNKLQAKFAAERLSELRAILDEEAVAAHLDNALALASNESSATTLFESANSDMSDATRFSMIAKMAAPPQTLNVTALVFTDTTIVTVVQDSGTTQFTTTAKTNESLAVEVATLYGLDVENVKAALVIESKERASRPAERGDMIQTSKGEARVGKAVTALIDQLDAVDDETVRGQLIADLLHEINGVKVSRESAEAEVAQSTRIQIENKHVIIGEDGNYTYISGNDAVAPHETEATEELELEVEEAEDLLNLPEVKGVNLSGGKNKEDEEKPEDRR